MQIAFEKTLAFFCGPALAGIKPASLVSFSKEQYPELPKMISEYNRSFRHTEIRFRILCSCEERSMLLVYRKGRLQTQLTQPAVAMLLRSAGYSVGGGVEMMLDDLQMRMTQTADFPHEIGLFLGYPVEDVLGFLENKGKNYSYCGHWKVYSDVERAKKLFAQYDRCRNTLCRKICDGCSITHLFTA